MEKYTMKPINVRNETDKTIKNGDNEEEYYWLNTQYVLDSINSNIIINKKRYAKYTNTEYKGLRCEIKNRHN